MKSKTTLERLLDPYSLDIFFEEYYEKKPLIIKRGDKNYYQDILTSNDIDRYLQNRRIPCSQLGLVKKGENVPYNKWGENHLNLGFIADNEKLYDYFNDGATIVINASEHSIPRLTDFSAKLEKEFGFTCQCNLYVTPAGKSQGFDLHHDSHDVLILQTTGSKQWTIYGSPYKLPTDKIPATDYDIASMEEPLHELTIEQGDLIYIPRGYIHYASTTDETSAHITTGLYPLCTYQLLKLIAKYAEDLPEYRASVPFGYFNTQSSEDFESWFKKKAKQLIDEIPVEELKETAFKVFLNNRRPSTSGRFISLLSLADLDSDTILVKDPSLIILFKETEDKKEFEVTSKSRSFRFPKFMRSPIESIFANTEIKVDDIPGFITSKGKIDLAKKFIREGLLSIKETGN